MKRAYYELAVQNPGAVAWHCALKLEMAVALTKALLTEQMRSEEVPGREGAKAQLAEGLHACMGMEMLVDDVPDMVHYGIVDDYYASFKWSEGGMLHAHIAIWIVGAPASTR